MTERSSHKVGLRCLGGEEAPPEIGAGLARLANLPESARRRFWDALVEALPDPIPERAERSLTAFSEKHAVVPDDLAGAIKATRFLVREASRRDLPRDGLGADLTALGASDEARAIVLEGYEPAKARLRREALQRTVVSHGKVLLDVDWRVDSITASSQAEGLGANIAFLTLRYTEGGKTESITLQAPPAILQKLAASCKAALR